MKKPSAHRFLLGNNLACLISACVSAFIVFFWSDGELEVIWLVPAFCVAFTAGCFKARSEVRNYRAWARAWNTMAGESDPKPRVRFRFTQLPLEWNVWIGVLLVGIGQPLPSPSAKQAYALAFIASTGWVVFRLFQKARRRIRPPGQLQNAEHIVTQCLPVPKRSPDISEIRSALPSYCQTVLRQPRKSER